LNLLVDYERQESLDDLNMLLDDGAQESLDDLNMLLGDDNQEPLDDLNMLVNDANQKPPGDLSQAQSVEPSEPSKKEANIPDDGYPGLDNLGMLVEEKAVQPKIKPTITPEENFKQYKSEVINIIIQLKKEGLSVDETTDRFNDEGVLTLSGKSRWSTKSINQIYRFIDAVKK
jgi:hypothetical protein